MKHLLPTLALLLASAGVAADCAPLLEQQMRVLRSQETADLCERYAGKPLLVVNTASYCGYTPQFAGLEALYREYAARGLRIAGFPSNDFRQEAADEEETARVCLVNYGVTFDMYAEVHVRGAEAHPFFAALAAGGEAPAWNFHKYLVDREGRVIASFPSAVAPDSPELRAAIEKLL